MKNKIIKSLGILRMNFPQNPLELIARIGVFGTFLGHGIIVFGVNPKWISYLTTVGFSADQAMSIMPLIGIMDIIVAIITLVSPIREILIWAAIWAFLTALIRPIAGESFLDFVERSANWCLPLILLMIQFYPKKTILFTK